MDHATSQKNVELLNPLLRDELLVLALVFLFLIQPISIMFQFILRFVFWINR
jgi:hypothetical protein